jgi:hypothetical protein
MARKEEVARNQYATGMCFALCQVSTSAGKPTLRLPLLEEDAAFDIAGFGV